MTDHLGQSVASPKAGGRMPTDPVTAYYQGCYDECRKLLTSPRFNRPQREVIEDEAWRLKAELEDRGVTFKEATDA